MLERVRIDSAHLCNQTNTGEEDTMVLLIKKLSCGRHKYFHQVWHLANYPHSTQCSLGEREDRRGYGGRGEITEGECREREITEDVVRGKITEGEVRGRRERGEDGGGRGEDRGRGGKVRYME